MGLVIGAAVPAPSVPGVSVLVGTDELADLDQLPEVITSLRDYLPTLTVAFATGWRFLKAMWVMSSV